MTVFIVASRDPSPELESAISKNFAGKKNLRFTDRVWFVSSASTAREVAEILNVKKGGLGGVVVMPTTGAYYGLANTSIWDWLRAAIEEGENG